MAVNGGRARVLASAGTRAFRVVWGVLRWAVAHYRFSLVCVLVGLAGWVIDSGRAVTLAVAALVVPGLVSVVWSSRWPVGYERLAAGPSRRFRWRRWVRRNWAHLARECGLSVQRTNGKGESVWIAPSLMDVITNGWKLTIRVRARTGQTVADLAGAVAAIGTAAGAVSWRSISRSPSALDIVLVMADPLAGTRHVDPNAAPSATDGLAVRVGRVEDGSDLIVNFADPWHLAMQGQTRSGKSVLTYGLLAGLAGRSEALVCGLDPTGILLGPWTSAPGAELRHLGTANLAGAGEVMARIVAAMDDRIAWLMASGLDKVPDPSPDMPVLVVVMEEYPGLLAAAEADDTAEGRKPAERIAPRIKAGVRRLVQEGAKAGIRVVLLAQRMDASIVGGAERSNLGTRVTLRVDNGDAVRMLHSDAPADLVKELASSDPGKGVIDTPGKALRWFKADLLTYPEYVAAVHDADHGTGDRTGHGKGNGLVLSLVKNVNDACEGVEAGAA